MTAIIITIIVAIIVAIAAAAAASDTAHQRIDGRHKDSRHAHRQLHLHHASLVCLLIHHAIKVILDVHGQSDDLLAVKRSKRRKANSYFDDHYNHKRQ